MQSSQKIGLGQIELSDRLPTDKYVLNELSLTSAGVFNADGKLLRTLWSGVKKTEGTYDISTIEWDGLNDDGEDVLEEASYYKVVANNISEYWEGVIGNSSDTLVGEDVWHGMGYPTDGIIIGDKLYHAYGPNEQTGTIGSFLLSNPQKKIEELDSPRTYPSYSHLGWDGEHLYFAGVWQWSAGELYSGISSSTLPNLRSANLWNNPADDSVPINGFEFPIMDKMYDESKPKVTGLAVFTGFPLLVITRGKINNLRLVNKDTGVLVREYTTFINPKCCKINLYGQLWLIHGLPGEEVAEIFAISVSDGELISVGQIPGFNNVRALAISDNAQYLYISDDRLTDNRMRMFSTTSGAELVAFGSAESYYTDATFKPLKFMWSKFDDPDALSFIIPTPEGGFWLNDVGNFRMVKLSSNNGSFETEIQFLPLIHEMTIDMKDPTRVFSAFKEFKINYAAPLEVGNVNRAWRLVKNWGYSKAVSDANVFIQFDKMRAVETMSNGRTYGLVIDDLVDPKPASLRFVELVEGGVLRDTGVTIFDDFFKTSLKKNGRIVRGNYVDSNWVIYEKLITGFDSSHNPIIGDETIISRVLNANIPSEFPDEFGEMTSNGSMIQIFTRKGSSGDFHISSSKLGGTDIGFKTTKGVVYPLDSDYPLYENTFDIRDSVQHFGNNPIALDNWFMWGYHGEFWKNSQTNYWHMLTEDGLFLYAFGTDGTKPSKSWTTAPWGMAGNAIRFGLAKTNGQVYLYHNDESFHGGIHRWKINNLESIKEFKLLLT